MISPLVDENTRAIFCETVGTPPATSVKSNAIAEVAQ